MSAAAVRRSAGFTVVELALVMVMMGILATIAVPTLRGAVSRADAASIVADARTVELAVRSYAESNGSLPRSGRWGEAPASLAGFLPENMSFVHKDATYRLITQKRRGVVRLRVRYPRGSATGEALKRFRRPGAVTWTRRRTDFYVMQ